MTGQVIDIADFADHLRAIGQSLGSSDMMDGLFDKARMVLVSQTKMAFHNATSPSGIPWKGLNHQRVRGSGTPAPLRDTGELMASLTANGPGHIDRREGHFLVFGSVHVKSWHNEGGTITAVRAKFLCIPATKAALYAGSPRNFPGKLFFLWNEETGKGVAIGIASDYRQQGSQAEAYEERRKKIRALMKTAPRLGGVRQARPRRKLIRLSTWGRLAKAIKTFKKSKFWQRVKSLLGFKGKKRKKRTAIKKATSKTLPMKKKATPGKREVHYYLRKSVDVPARTFLEITDATQEKMALITWDHCAIYIQKRITGEG